MGYRVPSCLVLEQNKTARAAERPSLVKRCPISNKGLFASKWDSHKCKGKRFRIQQGMCVVMSVCASSNKEIEGVKSQSKLFTNSPAGPGPRVSSPT